MSTRRADLARMCTAVGAVMLAFPFAILLVASLLFAAGVSIAWYHVPAAAVLAGAFAAWLIRASFPDHRLVRGLLALGAVGVTFAISVLVEAPVYDSSWDGQTYHALAIHAIEAGWNPVRDAAPDVAVYPDELGYFAKGPWLLAASVSRFTGSFEAGKAFHLYLMVSAFPFWLAVLLSFRRIRGKWLLLGAVPIALNPVSAAQLFTHYVDGQLASLIAIVMALLVLASSRRAPLTLYPALTIAVALAINTKLNGALYIIIIAGGFWIWRLFASRAGARALGAWLLVGVLAGAATGSNPYLSQFAFHSVTHGNPFHPHEHWSSIINLESESVLPGTGRVGRLARTLLAPSVIWTESGAGYKLPFTVSRTELQQFASPDVRFGGFGPLFSGALLLALATLVLLPWRRRRLRVCADLLVLAGSILVSVLVFSEAWWARLAPQLGFLPALVALVGMLVLRPRWQRCVPRALLVTLCLNSGLVLGAHAFLAVRQSAAAHRQLDTLRRADAPVPVTNLEGFPGVRYRLERAGVDFYETESLPCREAEQESLTLDLYTCRP